MFQVTTPPPASRLRPADTNAVFTGTVSLITTPSRWRSRVFA